MIFLVLFYLFYDELREKYKIFKWKKQDVEVKGSTLDNTNICYYYFVVRPKTNSVAHSTANFTSLNNKLSTVVQGTMILNYIFTVFQH